MRTKPRRPGKWAHPLAIENEYVAVLTAVAVGVETACKQAVEPALSELRLDDFGDIPESMGWYERMRQAFIEASIVAASYTSIDGIVSRYANRVSDFNRRQLMRMLRSAYSVDIFVADPSLAATMSTWEAENIRLIKSIPQQALEKMHGRIVASVRKGESLKSAREMLQSEYGVTRRRAELIARDQVGKLNGDLTRDRQQKVGVKEYDWMTSRDERVRLTHRAHEGKTYQWTEPPPSTGHPGEDYQCRCWARAKLPLLADLNGLAYGAT